MGVTRYYYPAAWDTTARDELGGKSIYEMLHADKSAWKGDSEEAKTLAALIGATKQEVTPILAWAWNEGVLTSDAANPATVEGYNGYTSESAFRFLFGMQANEDGSVADDTTTFDNTYAVFGIDVVADGGAIVDPIPTPDPDPAPTPDPDPDPAPIPTPDPDDQGQQGDGQQQAGDKQNQSGSQFAATGDAAPVLPLVGLAVAAALVIALGAFFGRIRERDMKH